METISHEVWVNAPKEKVFEAITTVQGLNGWWGKALKAEPLVGSVVEFDHGLGDSFKMRITHLVPQQQIAWRCISDFSDVRNPASEWLGHQLNFDLKTAEGRPELEWLGPRMGLDSQRGHAITILAFEHAGWSSNARWYSFCNSAWGTTLAGLARYCERGN